MNRQELTRLKDLSVRKFVDELTFIISVINDHMKDDDFMTVKERFSIIRTENPECVLLVAGPYLWEYREIIKKGNVDDLLGEDFKKEIQQESTNIQKAEMTIEQVHIIVSKVKKVWIAFSDIEKSVLKEKFRNLVKQYATYVSACKKIQSI